MVGVFVKFVTFHQVFTREHSITDVTLCWETPSLTVVTLEMGFERDLTGTTTPTQTTSINRNRRNIHVLSDNYM